MVATLTAGEVRVFERRIFAILLVAEKVADGHKHGRVWQPVVGDRQGDVTLEYAELSLQDQVDLGDHAAARAVEAGDGERAIGGCSITSAASSAGSRARPGRRHGRGRHRRQAVVTTLTHGRRAGKRVVAPERVRHRGTRGGLDRRNIRTRGTVGRSAFQ